MFDHQSIYFVLSFTFLYGIATGSFVTLVSYRVPKGQEIVFKPSYCTNCHTSLRMRDLIPLFSWLFQRGKCRYCRTRISIRYPLIEFTLAVVFVGIVYMYGPTLQSFLYLALATELWILIVTDLEEFIIPDSIQMAVFATGIAYCIWRQALPLDVTLSVVVGLSIGLILHYGYLYLRKKDALGWGDVKFLGVIGTWLPLHDFVTFFLFAGLIGTITGLMWRGGSKGGIFPFGPALALSLLINVLFPDIIGRVTF